MQVGRYLRHTAAITRRGDVMPKVPSNTIFQALARKCTVAGIKRTALAFLVCPDTA